MHSLLTLLVPSRRCRPEICTAVVGLCVGTTDGGAGAGGGGEGGGTALPSCVHLGEPDGLVTASVPPLLKDPMPPLTLPSYSRYSRSLSAASVLTLPRCSSSSSGDCSTSAPSNTRASCCIAKGDPLPEAAPPLRSAVTSISARASLELCRLSSPTCSSLRCSSCVTRAAFSSRCLSRPVSRSFSISEATRLCSRCRQRLSNAASREPSQESWSPAVEPTAAVVELDAALTSRPFSVVMACPTAEALLRNASASLPTGVSEEGTSVVKPL